MRRGTGDHSICPIPFQFPLHNSCTSWLVYIAVTKVNALTVSLPCSVGRIPGSVSLYQPKPSGQIGEGGLRQLRRNGKLPNRERVLALSPVAPKDKVIKVECSWANSWQEQEVMFGQVLEKYTSTWLWGCNSKSHEGMLMWWHQVVRDVVMREQRDDVGEGEWVLLSAAAFVGTCQSCLIDLLLWFCPTKLSWLDKHCYFDMETSTHMSTSGLRLLLMCNCRQCCWVEISDEPFSHLSFGQCDSPESNLEINKPSKVKPKSLDLPLLGGLQYRSYYQGYEKWAKLKTKNMRILCNLSGIGNLIKLRPYK